MNNKEIEEIKRRVDSGESFTYFADLDKFISHNDPLHKQLTVGELSNEEKSEMTKKILLALTSENPLSDMSFKALVESLNDEPSQ